MTGEQASDGITDTMVGLAKTHAETMKSNLSIELDHSPQSLQVVDQTLACFHPDGFTFDVMTQAYGAYVGEVVRRELGGKWVKESDGTGASLRGVGDKATIYPFVWLMERVEAIKSREGGHALADSYASLLTALDMSEKVPAAIPDDFVEKQAGSSALPVGGASSEETEPAKREEASQEDLAKCLAMSPALCFILVSAIDGNIDDKEMKVFGMELAKHASHANPLVSQVFSAPMEQVGQQVAEIVKDGEKAALMIPMKLMLARQAAEQLHANHAPEFFQTLIDMSTKVAEASGGFLGFGSKISKEERSALNLIGTLLGPRKDQEA